jgi:hypothetical protein
MEQISYAILNKDGRCVNRCLWDGVSAWQPPEGHTVIADPDNLYPIELESAPAPPPVDNTLEGVLSSLTDEQKAALAELLKTI